MNTRWDSLISENVPTSTRFPAFLYWRFELTSDMKKLDLSGQRFGRLVANAESGRSASGNVLWLCVCDCGVEVVVSSGGLHKGGTKSCGCLKADNNRARSVTHNMSRTPEYRVWFGMRKRCNNPTDDNYPYYGGRGITISGDWDSFENFFRDMGFRPDGLTLERVDNEKGYSKENCCWASRSQQSINQRVRKDSMFGVKGVNAHKDRYRAMIVRGGVRKHLGVFNTFEEAVSARKTAEREFSDLSNI